MNLRELRQIQKQLKSLSQPEKRTEAVVGFRVWHVLRDGGLPKLKSVTQNFLWPYRKPLVRDVIYDAGIHALKTAKEHSAPPSVFDPAGIGSIGLRGLYFSYGAHIAGEVYLWGKVAEHTYGYLAEFAYPKRLFCPPEMDPITFMQLEDEYGVPCEYREEFAKPNQPAPTPQMIQKIPSPPTSFYPQYSYYTYTTSTTLPGTGTIGGLAQGINSFDGLIDAAAQQLGYKAGNTMKALLGTADPFNPTK